MSLLQEWREQAYSQNTDERQEQIFWDKYFRLEKNVYEQILENPDNVVSGTVEELAVRYNMDLMNFVGFLDGINDSLRIPNPIEDMDEKTVVNLGFDKERLYCNMVEAEAEWLYGMEQWDKLLTEERRKELYKQQKMSKTVIKPKKIGRNEPCPCGSGKKYKKCCGVN